MYNHLLFLSYWFVNTSVLFIAGVLPGRNVILGDWRFNSFESSVYAGFWLTFLIWVSWDFAIARRFKLDKLPVTLGFFLFVNSISIWAVSRFSSVTGFVLVNFFWALVIGCVVTLLQRVVWKLIVKKSFSLS